MWVIYTGALHGSRCWKFLISDLIAKHRLKLSNENITGIEKLCSSANGCFDGFSGLQMLAIVIAGCAAIFIFFVIIAWHVYSNKRRPPLRSSVVIAEPLQPQVVCRSVPCQHPYYRVISEYTDHDGSREPALLNEKDENETKKSSKKFDYKEWSRSLSLGGISRKYSYPGSNSRRPSVSDVRRTLSLPSKTKPYFVA